MSKLLKNGGKLVKKNGRLVRTDDPAKCECCGPPPPPVKYICATKEDPCAQHPLDYGRWVYRSDGVWAIHRSRCAAQIPADTCTIADKPNRPGAFAGEIVDVGCKSVTPNTTKSCITEDEFNKGGWTKVSGPHDTLEICEDACNPPPVSCAACRLESASVTMSLPAYGKCGPIDLQLTIPLTQGGNNWSGSVVNALPGVIRSTFSVRVICSDPSAASAVYGVSFDGSFRCADDFAIQILPLTSGVVPQMPCCGSGDQELRVLTFDSGFIQYPNATATIKLNCQKADNPLP